MLIDIIWRERGIKKGRERGVRMHEKKERRRKLGQPPTSEFTHKFESYSTKRKGYRGG
jgi:hypothetical protein